MIANAVPTERRKSMKKWFLTGVDLAIISVIAALAGLGFGILTEWPTGIPTTIIAFLYVLVQFTDGGTKYATRLKDYLSGLVVITGFEIGILVVAVVMTMIALGMTALATTTLFGWTLPIGPTIFVVWLVVSVVFWLWTFAIGEVANRIHAGAVYH